MWRSTDRLDLPKLALLAAAVTVGVGRDVLRGRAGAEGPAVGVCALALAALLLAPAEMGARIEGWAAWPALLGLGWLARAADRAATERALGACALAVAGIAIGQALGLAPLAGPGVVTGTLGGTGHLGWTLAALLPFCRALPPWVTGVVCAALALSGSRTGWGMALAAAPLWVGRPRAVAALLGAGAAGLLDAAGIGDRLADLTDPVGTARGRLYLWRLYLSDPSWWLGLGGGPEAFVRRFPSAQAAFLAAHPGDAPFRSVLEHAHADLVELGASFGWVGIGGLVAAAARWGRAGPLRDPAAAALVALAVGGLASPVLFFAPTAAIGALAAGLRLGPPAPAGGRGAWVLLAALLAADGLLARRVASEVVRSEATWARIHGDRARAEERALRAAAIDPRNGRAWIERAAACVDPECRAEASDRAARDLPLW